MTNAISLSPNQVYFTLDNSVGIFLRSESFNGFTILSEHGKGFDYRVRRVWECRMTKMLTLHGGHVGALDVIVKFLNLLLEFVEGHQFIL